MFWTVVPCRVAVNHEEQKSGTCADEAKNWKKIVAFSPAGN